MFCGKGLMGHGAVKGASGERAMTGWDKEGGELRGASPVGR